MQSMSEKDSTMTVPVTPEELADLLTFYLALEEAEKQGRVYKDSDGVYHAVEDFDQKVYS